jgi:hypothetical protein
MITKVLTVSTKLNDTNNFLTEVHNRVLRTQTLTQDDLRYITQLGIPALNILSKLLNVPKSEVHSLAFENKLGIKEFEYIIDKFHKST